jgi:ADP-ribose pyrophosphatase YjhB (NUDIX family)
MDVRAVIINDGKLLMVQEKVDNRRSIPGGLADVSYTPKEVAVKECREEVGLLVEPLRLLAVMEKNIIIIPHHLFVLIKYLFTAKLLVES